MSDKASCNEGYTVRDTKELEDWRVRVGASFYATAEIAKKSKFFEIIRPNWRSGEVSNTTIVTYLCLQLSGKARRHIA
jgi:hypothetical protein